MKTIRRTLSFGKGQKKSDTPARTDNSSSGGEPSKAVAAEPAKPSAGRRITRSLSFNSKPKRKQQDAAPEAAAEPAATPAKRLTAAEFLASEQKRSPTGTTAQPQPPPASGGKKLQQRASSFGRQPKRREAEATMQSAAPASALGLDLASRTEQKMMKQAIAASDLQKYLQKMTDGDGAVTASPDGDAESRASARPSSLSKPRTVAKVPDGLPPPPGGWPAEQPKQPVGEESLYSDGAPPPPPPADAGGPPPPLPYAPPPPGNAPSSSSTAPLPKRTLNFQKAANGGAANGSGGLSASAPMAAANGGGGGGGGAIRLKRTPIPTEAAPSCTQQASDDPTADADDAIRPAPPVVQPDVSDAAHDPQPAITYMRPAHCGDSFGGNSRASTGAPTTAEARAAPETGASFGASSSSPAPKESTGKSLVKRLSFGRDKKKPAAQQQASQEQPKAAVVAKPSSPKASSAPKRDGEMDDEELEKYLQHLELTHDRERNEFESQQE